MTVIIPRYPTILHALAARAEQGSGTSAMTLLPEPGRVEPRRYDAMFDAAARCATVLAEHGVGRGDRVLFCLPTSWAFVTTLLGCQVLGAAPSAIAVPTSFGRAAGFDAQIKELVSYLRPAAIVTTAAMIEASGDIAGTILIDGDDLDSRATSADTPAHPIRMPAEDELAFIQCTSGSTGRPKGVMISHANLAANLAQIVAGTRWNADDTVVSWLPLYHDMGLISGIMTPVYTGSGSVLMPPTQFLRAPGEWLRAMSAHRGTIAAAPNFAFGYAADRVRDSELDGVDLSSWQMAFCGAEPIHPGTVRRFVDRFQHWGLRPETLVPCYGMAEATLVISLSRRGEPITVDTIDRTAAVADGRAVDVAPGGPGALEVVACGTPVAGVELRVVGEDGAPVAEDRIGEIQFRGPARTVGYFDLPGETTASIAAPDWWRTGDIGYLRQGRVRITGRAKDLIIIRGANYFPSDFEQAAESVPGVRLGGVAAVGYRPDDGDSEELHLIVESDLPADQHEPLRQAVRAAVGSRTGVPVGAVHLIPRRGLPKTTSGKLQRSKARRLYVESSPAAPA